MTVNLSSNRLARAFVIAACAWETLQVASNGRYTWTAGARVLRRSKAGRTALAALCALVSYHVVIE